MDNKTQRLHIFFLIDIHFKINLWNDRNRKIENLNRKTGNYITQICNVEIKKSN